MGIEARDYLADDFDEQAEDSPPEDAQDFHSFADYLRALPEADARVAELSEPLHPFLANDPRLGGTFYSDGDAIRFMESVVPDEDPERCEQYLDDFLANLRADHQRWSAHVAAHGGDAAWTLETGRQSRTSASRTSRPRRPRCRRDTRAGTSSRRGVRG